jgi:signal transduction histidine kinase
VNERARTAAAVVFVAGLLLLVPDAWFSPRVQVAVSAAAAALALSVVAIAGTRYRTARDPHALFLTIGFAVIAVQSLIFGVWWPVRYGIDLGYETVFVTTDVSITSFFPADSFSGAAPVYAFQAGWLIAGICFTLGVPWWDRRGHRPVRGWLTALIVGGIVLLVDRCLSLWYRHPQGPFGFVPVRLPVEPRALGTILGIAAAIALVVASGRELFRRVEPPHPWLGVAFAASVALPMSAVTHPTQGLAYVQWADILQLVVPAIAFAALLSAQRTETSRMRRASDRADEVLGGRAEIASVISHDVRSPVSSIKSIAASTIANYDRLDDAQRLEFVGMIEREAQVALGIVHQMSVALRIDAGTLELVRRPTAIATVVRQAIDGSETDGRRIEVEAAPGVTANVDAKWLAEAIRQGIDNAAAFSPEESSIRVGVEDAGEGAAAITIQDEGPGIPPERREEVFERFSRWRPQGYSDVPGSGLGLFICRGIVREHGGEITLENGAERGTILRILLPWSAD